MRPALFGILLWTSTAHAQDSSCTAMLTQEDLSTGLAAGVSALEAGDPEAYTAVTGALIERLPCLVFVPEPEQWAEILLGIAIVAHHQEQPWKSPLATALAIHPGIDRLVLPGHEIYDWQPPAPPQPTERVAPEGTRVFYDGQLVSRIPPPTGTHLAQRRDGDGLQTRLLVDEAIPEDWLIAPEIVSKKRDLGWGLVTMGGGIRLIHQSPELAGTYVPDAGRGGGGASASGHGWLRLVGPVGLRFGVTGQTSEIGPVDARLGPSWSGGPWTADISGALHTTSVLGDGRVQRFMALYPSMGGAYRSGMFTVSMDGGWAPWITTGNARLDVQFGESQLRPAIAVRTLVSSARFEIASTPARLMRTTETGAQLEFGMSWGGRRW